MKPHAYTHRSYFISFRYLITRAQLLFSLSLLLCAALISCTEGKMKEKTLIHSVLSADFSKPAGPSGSPDNHEISDGDPLPDSVHIEVVTARPDPYTPSLDVPGTIIPVEKTTVTAPYSAILEKKSVSVGKHVEAEDTLAVLSTDSLTYEIKTIEQRIEGKRRELERHSHMLGDTLAEARGEWYEAERVALRFLRSRNELEEIRSEHHSLSEIYEAGGISEKEFLSSTRQKEEAKLELQRMRLLLQGTLSAFLDEHELDAGEEITGKFSPSAFFTPARKKKFLTRKKTAHRKSAEIIEAGLYELHDSLAHLKKRLEKSVIAAPHRGIIDEVYAQRGSHVQNGSSLFVLYRENDLSIRVTLGESYAGRISSGSKAAFLLPAHSKSESANREISTHVENIIPKIDSRSKSFTVFLELPESAQKLAKRGVLMAGQFVQCRISIGETEPALSVPIDALIKPYGQVRAELWLFIPEREEGKVGTLQKRDVYLYGTDERLAFVSEGLDIGTKVCALPNSSFYEGMKVRRRIQ